MDRRTLLAFSLHQKWSTISALFALGNQEPLHRYQRVILADSGFTLVMESGPETRHGISWDDVLEITTYKWDLFSYDEICLAFTTDGESWMEVSEHARGFDDLCSAMLERWPTIPKDWFHVVMLPAFETNLRTLYKVGGLRDQQRTEPAPSGTTTIVDF